MAISSAVLKRIIADQSEEIYVSEGEYIERDVESKVRHLKNNREIIVITGMRRCGKSVLLNRIRKESKESDYYFNFEDERLVGFTSEDFQTLQETFVELFGQQKTYYFDEIQNIFGWEVFLRRLYNAGNKIYVTGSNANLFSEELGTKLTGRYLSVTMYPLSFRELARHKGIDVGSIDRFSTAKRGIVKKLYHEYFLHGGIPGYIRDHQKEYLHSLYESMVYRDIVARYKLTNPHALRQMLFFLASNYGKEITFSSLRKVMGAGSTTTASDYCGYLERSFLCFFLSRYSDSVKAQQQLPKKSYFVDHAFAQTVGFRSSNDEGRTLENIVYLELRRRYSSLFSYRDKRECDFVVQEGNTASQAIQVCAGMNTPETRAREMEGVHEAVKRFSLSKGIIITTDERSTETFTLGRKSCTIEIVPAWQWLLGEP